ncbi:unnamed protein product, partial [Larinioides sclopetarius]
SSVKQAVLILVPELVALHQEIPWVLLSRLGKGKFPCDRKREKCKFQHILQVIFNLKQRPLLKISSYARMDRKQIFHDPFFWQHFQKQVQNKYWKCDFSNNLLLDSLTRDSKLYKDDTVFTKRRQNIITWLDNESQWETIILGACAESASQRLGPHSQILKNLHILEAFTDFTEHLNCFYSVASTMSIQGQVVQPVSQYSSQVHDIDKLDPAMLVGYSERFEDNIATSLWDLCVDRHVRVNPHHQGHNVWHSLDEDESSRNIRIEALREMVCDKVSRRMQKNLNGVICKDMWNVDIVFFQGLPQGWMDKADDIMKLMKLKGVSMIT